MKTYCRDSEFFSRSQAGFTIIESLIAFIVVAVGILALMNFNSVSMRNNAEAKSRAEAINCAQAKINDLRKFQDVDMFNTLMVNGNDNCQGIGTNAALTRTWTVDTTVDPAVVTVAVTWTDMANVAQRVELTSEIKSEEIPQSMINLLASKDYNPNAFGWTPDGGSPDAGGDREIVEQVPVEEYEGDLPDGYADDWVYLYRITISGQISAQGSIDVDGTIVAPEVTGIIGDNPDVYAASCDWISVPDFYTCTAYYLSTTDGWSGSITYIAETNAGKAAKFCLPLEWKELLSPQTKEFTNVLYNQTIPVRVTGKNGNCESQSL